MTWVEQRTDVEPTAAGARRCVVALVAVGLLVTGCTSSPPRPDQGTVVDVLRQDWRHVPGVVADDDGLRVAATGRSIVRQDGSGGQPDPPLDLAGTHLVAPGDVSLDASFADVTADMRIFQEEVFGPFTSVTPFATEEEGIALANNSPFGLAAAIRTNDVARAHRVAAAIDCGIVWINDHHRLDPASPWGGVKLSGIGREFGPESFDDHFEVKSVMVNTGARPFDWYQDTSGQPRLN